MLTALLLIALIFFFYLGVALVLNMLEHSTFRLAEKHYHMGNIDDAIREFKEEVNKNPDNIQAVLFLGRIYQELAVYPEAIAHYEKAAQLYTGQRDVNILTVTAQLSKLYMKTHQVRKAFVSLLNLKENNVNTWEVFFYLGNIYVGQRMYSEAVDCYEEASRVNSEDFFSYFYAALCQVKVGAYTKALKLLEESGVDPSESNIPEAALLKGFLQRFTSLEDAAVTLERFIESSANVRQKCRAALLLGTSYARLGDLSRAADTFSRGLSLFPSDTRLLDELVLNYAWCLRRLELPLDRVASFKALEDIKSLNLPSPEYREILTFLRENPSADKGNELMPVLMEKWNHVVSALPSPADIHDYIPVEDSVNLQEIQKDFSSSKNDGAKAVVNNGILSKIWELAKFPMVFLRRFFFPGERQNLDLKGEMFQLLNQLVGEDLAASRLAFEKLSDLGTKDAVVVLIDGIFRAPKDIRHEIVEHLTGTMTEENLEGVLTYLRLYQKDQFTIKEHLRDIFMSYIQRFVAAWETLDYSRFRLLCDLFSRIIDENDTQFVDELIKLVPRIIGAEKSEDRDRRQKTEKFLNTIGKIRSDRFIRPLLSLQGSDREIWNVRIANMLKSFDIRKVERSFNGYYQSRDKKMVNRAKEVFSIAFGSRQIEEWLARNRSVHTVMLVSPHHFLKQTASFYLKQAGFNVITAPNGHNASQELKNQNLNLLIFDTEVTDMSLLSFLNVMAEAKMEKGIPVILVGDPSAEELSRYRNHGVTSVIPKPVEFDILMNRVVEELE
ncbi:MAG: hypothetical protein CVV64_02840 [Candidatus Wallbacteria bacterium HGW-Wallbacteria-1]|jgi:tetratricopeptide (TPR) repeat protein/CheY-like chemotaxis protein|uniref:Response regulatory domain-containing protein n=1 Tax=Candidatus Wallbacteria bacterium HGW-Wallbacteria-1 TaxID=2013854 RepID=A0A2N1PTF4_9BACT|nr:MAG: hypothetical protein CVV64_02840 [Candidatus Wallbacteria bacterium HGW-Wallbacteria-1]